jgi:aquaporin Z
MEREHQHHSDLIIPKLIIEFVGTFFLAFSIAMTNGDGGFQPLAVGFTLLAVIFMGGHISGAHYNPAVSLAVFIRQICPLKELLSFVPTQILATLAASAIVNGVTGQTVGPSPGKGYSTGDAFLMEFLWTFILITTVLNVATTKAQEDNSYFGLAVAGIIIGGAFCSGAVSGAMFNPALGTGFAIVDQLAGGDSLQYLWIYWIAPLLGSLVASLTFRVTNVREYKGAGLFASFTKNVDPALAQQQTPLLKSTYSVNSNVEV